MKKLGDRPKRIRFILILIIISLLAIALMPYFFGIKAEEAYYRLVNEWSEAGGIKLISTNYKRGWLKSSSETVYSLSREGEHRFDIKENDTVIHGPFSFGGILGGEFYFKPFLALVDSRVMIKPVSPNDFGDILKLIPPLEIASTISLDGSGTSNLSLPPFTYKHEKDNEALEWEGLKGNIEFSRDFHRIRADLQNPGIKTVDGSGLFSINQIVLNLNMDTENEQINRGSELNLTVKEIEFRGEDSEGDRASGVAISDLVFKGSSKLSEKTIDGSLVVELKSLKSNLAKYGPGNLKIYLRNIDRVALAEIRKSLNNDSDQNELNFMLKHLTDIVARSPEIEIKELSLLTPEGRIIGNAFLRIKGGNSEALNPFAILSALNAEARISVPSKFLVNTLEIIERQKLKEEFMKTGQQGVTEQVLDEMARNAAKKETEDLLKQSVFVLKDNKYELVATFKDGQFNLNGQALPLPLFPN